MFENKRMGNDPKFSWLMDLDSVRGQIRKPCRIPSGTFSSTVFTHAIPHIIIGHRLFVAISGVSILAVQGVGLQS